MRRIFLGLVALAAVVLSGIAFVESGDRAGGPRPNERLARIVLGGHASPVAPDEPEAPGPSAPDPLPLKPSPAPAFQPPEPLFRHVVRQGDTPTGIAIEYLGTGSAAAARRILDKNRVKDARSLKLGAELLVPVERFDSFVADGRKSLADLAADAYGKRDRVHPLLHANPKLASDPKAKVARGTLVFVPR